MRIESLSIRAVTVSIFLMIGVVAIVLSLLAGSYFRQAALDAQMNSLSRVIEVASQEMLKAVRGYTFDLGMRLGNSPELMEAVADIGTAHGTEQLVAFLDDPFINGFVGFSSLHLEKIRVYNQDLDLIGESAEGHRELAPELVPNLARQLYARTGVDRLKAMDALWLAADGPLHSTLVPFGGLRLAGYLEVIVDPAFNLPDIGKITKTPISIFSAAGEPVIHSGGDRVDHLLPVEYILHTSDGEPAFRIVGYEDVLQLNREMRQTQVVTTTGFLVLTISTLLLALWLFNRFLFVPVRKMIVDMQKMADGELNLNVSKKGLRDFSILASTFETMANQVRMRTNDLERLLDYDDSAILCFGNDGVAVYFNKRAASLTGYLEEEISDLDLRDIFVEDVAGLLGQSGQMGSRGTNKLHASLTLIHKDGEHTEKDAIIRPLQDREGDGYAIVLNTTAEREEAALPEDVVSSFRKSEQRMDAVEQSLNSLLELARSTPGLVSSDAQRELMVSEDTRGRSDKAALRELAVSVMHTALAAWEHDLGKTKLDLAEESRIWPVYIDKSTPTTRTLDRYLHIDSCPRNPRTQRVIDTAEFVLRALGRKTTANGETLRQALTEFRALTSGVKPAGS